jgi:hypothetical protein
MNDGERIPAHRTLCRNCRLGKMKNIAIAFLPHCGTYWHSMISCSKRFTFVAWPTLRGPKRGSAVFESSQSYRGRKSETLPITLLLHMLVNVGVVLGAGAAL